MTYFFHPDAEAEYLSQVVFYEERRAGLGAYFISDFETTMVKVVAKPSTFKQVDENIYLVSLKIFPFNILYQPISGEIHILAVAHKRRKPNYWKKRT